MSARALLISPRQDHQRYFNVLQDADYDVRYFNHVADLSASLTRTNYVPDVVVLTVRSNSSGRSQIANIRQLLPDVPIVVRADVPTTSDAADKFFRLGTAGVSVGNFDEEEFAALVFSVIKGEAERLYIENYKTRPSRLGRDSRRPTSVRAFRVRILHAGDKLIEVADGLSVLRINSISEQINDIRIIGEELRDGSRSLQIVDDAVLANAVRAALGSLSNIFDVVTSRECAQLVISGAVAGILGGTGWPAATMFGLSMAAWHGKDAFLLALSRLPNSPKRSSGASHG